MLKELVKQSVGREEWCNKQEAQTNKGVFTQGVLHKPTELDPDGERILLPRHMNATICTRQLR